MYLLDTNVVSETRKPRPHGGVLAWIETIPAEQLFLSAFTMGELQRGLELTYQNDIAKAREIHAWVDRLAGSLRGRLRHGRRAALENRRRLGGLRLRRLGLVGGEIRLGLAAATATPMPLRLPRHRSLGLPRL